MKTLAASLIVLSLALPSGAGALDLPLPPNALPSASDVAAHDDAGLPVGPWAGGEVARVTSAGEISRRAWRVPSSSLTTLQLMEPLRAAILAQGYRVLFECADRDCGGFDFRFALDLLSEPEMHVDLGDFRYLVAETATDDGPERIAILTSRSASTGFVHLTQISPGSAGVTETAVIRADPLVPAPAAPGPVAGSSLATTLIVSGRAVLEDLEFGTGAASLNGADYGSLGELARFLSDNPDASVVLVGHTDAEGDLDANIALSRRRATAVVEALQTIHGVDPARLRAEGVGYLAPRATNQTPEGRRANRRVEAVLVSALTIRP